MTVGFNGRTLNGKPLLVSQLVMLKGPVSSSSHLTNPLISTLNLTLMTMVTTGRVNGAVWCGRKISDYKTLSLSADFSWTIPWHHRVVYSKACRATPIHQQVPET